MKTRMIIFSMLTVFFSASVLAADPGTPKIAVVTQKQSDVFKVIYKGEQTGNVSLKVYDHSGFVVYKETIRQVNGFSQVLNFEGMTPGEYVVEITDANGKSTQTINYRFQSIVDKVHVAKVASEGKYLVALTNEQKEKINVKIFDGENHLVYDNNQTVDGSFGLIYNLQQVKGAPTFKVTDKTGKVKVVKY